MRRPPEAFRSSSDASACSAFVTHRLHTRHSFRLRAPFIMGPRRRGAMVGSWQGRRECPYQEIRARPRTRPGAVQRGPAAQRFIVKGALGQLDDHPFARERRPILVSVDERPRAGFESLQQTVAVTRLVVEEDEAAGADGPRERDCVGDARVTPAYPLLVFVLEVLRVVEEDVDLFGDGGSRDPVARLILVHSRKRRLMIWQIREARGRSFDPEADRRPWMGDEVGYKPCAVDRPRLPRNVVKGHLSRDLAEVDREERWGEGTRNALPETQKRRWRSPDVQ